MPPIVVVDSQPGYLPDKEPIPFDKYSEALHYMVDYAQELAEKGFYVTPIVNGWFEYSKPGDLFARTVEIVKA